MKKVISYCLLLAMLVCLFPGMGEVQAATKITDKEYQVTLKEKNVFFIGNEKKVSGKVGSKVFLTYTVEKTTSVSLYQQHGVVATLDATAVYPYLDGGAMNFSDSVDLFDEGYTYLFCFERTKNGFEYQGFKMNGEEEKRVIFATKTGAEDGEWTNYGIWAADYNGGSVSTVLRHVRCYDEKGNDLGVYLKGRIEDWNALLDVHPTVSTYSEVVINDKGGVALSNAKRPATSDSAVYMEYEVAEVDADVVAQAGLIVTNSPLANFPAASGNMHWDGRDKNNTHPLLYEGAKYFICFKKQEEKFIGVIQRTVKGVTETFCLPNVGGLGIGDYDPTCEFYSLWFSEGGAFSAKLKNFKCYDEQGNSLGVQSNILDVDITTKGEIIDYTQMKAAYYCKDNGRFIVLADDRVAYVIDKDGAREQINYIITDETLLRLNFADGKESYEYGGLILTGEDGTVYDRYRQVKATFVTGDETFVVTPGVEENFRLEEPEKPTKKNNTFKGWCLADGTEYKFGDILTESITLYAKWQDKDGNEYLAMEADVDAMSIDIIPAIAISLASVVLIGSAVGCIVITKKKAGKRK